MLKKNESGAVKGAASLYLSDPGILQVQPILPQWQRNQGILRQALLSPSEKTEKASGEKGDKRDFVEAINLYPTGSDGGEYTSQLLSQLTGSLPNISSSQVSSVLNELEPAVSQEGSSSITEKQSTDKLNEKSTLQIHSGRVEKHETDKGSWYTCRACGHVTLDETRAVRHTQVCPGVRAPTLACIACANLFRNETVLKAHLLLDHSAAPSEHPQLSALSLSLQSDTSLSLQGGCRKLGLETDMNNEQQTDSMPHNNNKDNSNNNNDNSNNDNDNSNNSNKIGEREVKREKRAGKKLNPHAVKMEREAGLRCKLSGCSTRLLSAENMDYHQQCHSGAGWKCPECAEESVSWPKLCTHLFRRHAIDMELYACDLCSYKTNSLSKLMNLHRRTHGEERPFLCDNCGKGFKTTKQLRNHRRIHKSKDKTDERERGEDGEGIECKTCGRRFSCMRILRHHRDIVHRKLKPYLCSDCGHSAASKSSLRLHARQHTGEKPYSCGECEFRSSDHNSLRRHRMRHTGARRYACPHCPYASIQSSTFKTHLKNKHPGLDVGLMFSCEVCPFKTVKKENFLAHTSYHTLKPLSPHDEDIMGGGDVSTDQS